jgi:ABC-type oligopeptide transport system ATPase subunit
MEIAYVELTGAVFFKEERLYGGIMAFQVYAVDTDQGLIVIRPGGKRYKRIGIKWLKERTDYLFQSKYDVPFSRTERIKFLINEIKIKKIYWKHRITEKMVKRIIDAVTRSKEIYG